MGVSRQRLPLRGGNWNNTASAGVFALNLNNPRVNSNHNVGFRSALLSWSEVMYLWVHFQYREIKGAYFHAERQKIKLVMDAKSKISEIRNT